MSSDRPHEPPQPPQPPHRAQLPLPLGDQIAAIERLRQPGAEVVFLLGGLRTAHSKPVQAMHCVSLPPRGWQSGDAPVRVYVAFLQTGCASRQELAWFWVDGHEVYDLGVLARLMSGFARSGNQFALTGSDGSSRGTLYEFLRDQDYDELSVLVSDDPMVFDFPRQPSQARCPTCLDRLTELRDHFGWPVVIGQGHCPRCLGS